MAWKRPELPLRLALVALSLAIPLTARADTSRIKALAQAELYEQQLDWEKACEIYEQVLSGERVPEIRQRYLHALRRCWQVRRHRDPGFRKEVLGLEYAQAVKLYGVIQDSLLTQSVDRKTTEPVQLLHKGIEELGFALADPQFCRQYVPSHRLGDVREFRDFLQKTWGTMAGLTRSQLQKQVREVALAAHNRLGLSSTVAILEIAAGACYAFDEYTVYLTPSQLRELCDSLKGEFVGVGITLGAQNGKLVIADIAPFSPAAEAMPPLAKEEQIVSIDKKPLANVGADIALQMLEGQSGSSVELEIYSPGSGVRTITLRRRALFVPSVSYQMQSDVIAYMHIACFQDTTLQEVDDALATLNKSGMKTLVLDLRGNVGGLFEVAVDVSRRFLASGIVVSIRTADSSLGTIYQARNPDAVGVPMVVLVDSDTASSAEVLAGALKDNKRGRLVGQTTFGKGCTQTILKLPAGPGGVPTGGLRITVARFFTPEGLPYSNRGVMPHMFVERFLMGAMNGMDHQLEEALIEAQRLVTMSSDSPSSPR